MRAYDVSMYKAEVLRAQQGVNQISTAELARQIKVSRPIVIEILKGKPNVRLDFLERVALGLNVPVMALFAPEAR